MRRTVPAPTITMVACMATTYLSMTNTRGNVSSSKELLTNVADNDLVSWCVGGSIVLVLQFSLTQGVLAIVVVALLPSLAALGGRSQNLLNQQSRYPSMYIYKSVEHPMNFCGGYKFVCVFGLKYCLCRNCVHSLLQKKVVGERPKWHFAIGPIKTTGVCVRGGRWPSRRRCGYPSLTFSFALCQIARTLKISTIEHRHQRLVGMFLLSIFSSQLQNDVILSFLSSPFQIVPYNGRLNRPRKRLATREETCRGGRSLHRWATLSIH